MGQELDQARTDFERYMAALNKIEKERAPLVDALSAIEQRVDGIKMILEGLSRSYPDLAATSGEDAQPEASGPDVVVADAQGNTRVMVAKTRGATGKSLVLRLLNTPDFTSRWMLISEMVDSMIQLGWLEGSVEENTNRIRIATLRLVDDGTLEKAEEKAHRNAFRYRLRSNVVQMDYRGVAAQ